MEPTANLSMLAMIQQGWLATYPLILMSIVSLTVIAERLWSLRNLVGGTAELTRGVHADLARGDVAAAAERTEAARGSASGRVFAEVVRQGGALDAEELADLGAERRFEEMEHLKRPLWILGTVASSAPFIGLFGTVVGIIKAFHNMAALGSGGFAVVASGISEALVATALGLGVAIIALIFYNYFQVRLDRIEAALSIGTARVIEGLRTVGSSAPRKARVADGLR
ncbi:MAG: MotA/TolQ/ExbB proton channel family protein [Deltaproteobacteria bacterium]|nr:MotA/TolQ/ExbB proton channel family protein [Deltaproteobacteria bacterium]